MRIKVNQNVTSYWLGKMFLLRAEPPHLDRSEDYKWSLGEPTSANASPSHIRCLCVFPRLDVLSPNHTGHPIRNTRTEVTCSILSFFAGVTRYRGVDVLAVVWVIGVSSDGVGVVEVCPPSPVALRLIPFFSPPVPRNYRQALSPPSILAYYRPMDERRV